jgi:non-ribosomal peptide synthetase component E (peptide arylation enzyme)
VAVFDGGQLTYRQLDQASDRVAANLVATGIEPGDRVAQQCDTRCDQDRREACSRDGFS